MTVQLRHMIRLNDAARVVNAIAPRFRSRKAAYGWFRSQPLPSFAGQTALQLVQADRVDEVLAYVATLDAEAHV
jgi:hypothetical protein